MGVLHKLPKNIFGPVFLLLFLLFSSRSLSAASILGHIKLDGSLHETAHRLNDHLTAWTLVGFGFFSMLDGGCYFVFGQALLKGRYF